MTNAPRVSADPCRMAASLGIHLAILLLACCEEVGCGRPERRPARSPTREAATRKDYYDWVDRAEMPLKEQLERFEAADRKGNDSALKARAREVLAQARSAREALERSGVAQPTASGRGEELIFLNHLVLGFQKYLQSGGGPAPLEELESVLRRARAHQKFGRAPANGA